MFCLKAWDHEGIQHWKIEPFTQEDNKHGLLEESSFATLFPKYREKYLREVWPLVDEKLKEHVCIFNVVLIQKTVVILRNTFEMTICIREFEKRKLATYSSAFDKYLRLGQTAA